MQISQTQAAETMTFTIEGRIDTTTSLDGNVKTLILDMKGVEYISSAGLRVLLSAQKKMNRNRTLKLTGVCDAVMDVFEMTGFSDILVIE